MKKNIRLYILVFALIFLCGINTVWALPDSFEVKSFAEVHGLPETHTKPTDCNSDECYGTTLKFYEDSSGKTGVFCTLFEETSPAWKNNSTCKITDQWSDSVRYSVGQIVNAVIPSLVLDDTLHNSDVKKATMSAYLSAEMALNRFLYDIGRGDETIGGWNISTSKISKELNSQYSTYLQTAEKAYSIYDGDKNKISFNTNSLRFTLSEDGEYYSSNVVKVTAYGNVTYKLEGVDGTIYTRNDMIQLKIPSKNLKDDQTTTITVKVESTKSYAYARRYYCGEEYQPVTPIALEYETINRQAQISGKITKESPKGKLIIKKVDATTQKILSGRICSIRVCH